MKRLTILLPLLLVALPVSGQESKPYVWGDHLTPDALAAAVKVATAVRGQPWAIFADHSQTLPETHYVDAFLPPTVSTARFRRGIVQRFECKPAVRDGDCSEWAATGEPQTYIQIADKARFSPSLVAERPIPVKGNYSDNDLISLVAFIHSKPHFRLPPATGRIPDGVSGREPIAEIRQDDKGQTMVFLCADCGSGETAIVSRTPQGWTLADMGSWVR